MTRLAFVSDLHAEYQMEVCGLVAGRAREARADILVLAGDVSPDHGMLRACLKVLSGGADTVLFLPGNHDLWCVGDAVQRLDSAMKYHAILPEICSQVGVGYLGLEPVAVGDITFCAVTGWYDFSLRSEAAGIPLEAYREGRFHGVECADRRFFRWYEAGEVLSDEAVASWMRERLRKQLSEASGKRKVLVTHFMVGGEPLMSTGVAEQDFVMGFLGDRTLGEIIDQADNVDLLVSGHWHIPFRVERRCSTGPYPWEGSPVGYPRERPGGIEDRVRDAVQILDL